MILIVDEGFFLEYWIILFDILNNIYEWIDFTDGEVAAITVTNQYIKEWYILSVVSQIINKP